MRSGQPSFRHFHLALWFAWMAVIAHLGLGYISTGHAAQMLAADADGWVIVCTPAGLERIGLDGSTAPAQSDDTPLDAHYVRCLACSAATVATLPASNISLPLATLDYDLLPRPAAADPDIKHYVGIRPPPRAPPRFS